MTSRLVLALCVALVAAGATAADHGRDGADRRERPAASKTIRGIERMQRRHDGAFVARERIAGRGRIDADHVVIEGELSPGDSPGCISFGGDITFGFTATLIIELAGVVPCTGHDQTSAAGTMTINGATLEVVLIDGFVPQFGDRFDILDWGSLSGSFGTIDASAATLPAPLLWDNSQLYVTGEIAVGVQSIADGDLFPWDNPDGQLTVADLLMAQQILIGIRTAGALQFAHGDMNADGLFSVADLLLIEQAVQ